MWRDRGIDKRGRCRGAYTGLLVWLWVRDCVLFEEAFVSGAPGSPTNNSREFLGFPKRRSEHLNFEDEPRPHPTPSLKVSIEAHPVGPASPALLTA